jgi:hypothetical protein
MLQSVRLSRAKWACYGRSGYGKFAMRHRVLWWVTLLAVAGLLVATWGYLIEQKEIIAIQAKSAANALNARRQIAELRQKLSAAQSAATAAEKKPQASAQAEGNSRAPRRRASPILDFSEMRKDPAFAALWRKQRLRTLNLQLGDTLTKLNLPPEELAKLKNLLVDRDEAAEDAREAGRDADLDQRTLIQAVQNAMNEVNDEIKALVGAEGFSQIQSAQQTGTWKIVIQNQVGADLTAAGSPLSAEQIDALAQIYTKVHSPNGGGLASNQNGAPDPQTGLNAAAQAILDQATPLLSPAQVPVFRQSLIESVEQQQYFLKRNAAARGP